MTQNAAVHVQPVEDLRWLYLESACELGFRATPLPEAAELRFEGHREFDELAIQLVPGWVSPPVPSARARTAATRQKRVRDILRTLSAEDRHIIDAAYGLRNMASVAGGKALMSEFGQAARLAYVVLRKNGTREQAEEAAHILKAAQQRYLRERRKQFGQRYEKSPDDMTKKEKRAERVRKWRDQYAI